MKFRLFTISGDGLAIALQIAQEDHYVDIWFKDKKARTQYQGILPQVDDYRKNLDKETICIFDMVKMGSLADKLKKSGHKVYGAGALQDTLELDRDFMMRLAKVQGIKVPDYHNFDSIDKAKKFIQDNEKLYVFKPAGNKPTMFTYVSDEKEEMLIMLDFFQKKIGNKTNFILQERIDGIPLSTEAWFVEGQLVPQSLNSTFELKRFMEGDKSVQTGAMGSLVWFWKKTEPTIYKLGIKKLEKFLAKFKFSAPLDLNMMIDNKGQAWLLEATCYDGETEVLTKNGWKLFKDTQVGEKVVTLNPNTHVIEYQKATAKIEKNYKGEMYHFGNQALDLLVTPNHWMFLNPRKEKDIFIQAKNVTKHGYKIYRTGIWKGRDEPCFILPGYIEQHQLGRHKKNLSIEHKAKKMKMEDWLRFLGLYIAEGSIGGRGCHTNIAQSLSSPKWKEIIEILKKMPFKFSIGKEKDFQISSTQLTRYIESLKLGKSYQKFIPERFKELNSFYLNALLEGYMLGDGNYNKRSKQGSCVTTSKRLADDIQEILLKTGKLGNICFGEKKNTIMKIKGKTYKRNHNQYLIGFREQRINTWINGRQIGQQDYDGKVYCLSVPNRTLFVRRNGKPAFCGNSRIGYDAIYALMEVINYPLGEFFYELANNDIPKLRPSFDWAGAVRLSTPPYPHGKNVDEDIPVLGDYDTEHFKLLDVKFENGNLLSAGTDGVIGEVTGKASKIKVLDNKVYAAIDKIKIPNIQYRRDIFKIADKKVDQLKQQNYF
jgi:phosphoribosylamine-glycine ligase/intein/homing endonuclease